jgi:hypothetical protein
MSRKGKNKKQKVFSKNKFRNIYCPQCNICDPKSKADFCYATVYKANPKLFNNGVFPNLTEIADDLSSRGSFPNEIDKELFFSVFCLSAGCNANCSGQGICFPKFQKQAALIPSKAQIRKQNKKKKDKHRQVYKPYATFFCKNDEKFKVEVQRILHGNNNIEQDTNQELSGGSSGNSDGSAEDGES